MQFPDMSSRAGMASPAWPETAYNPDNRSSKNISSCEWICPQSCRCPVHFFVISIMARYSIFRRLSSEGNTVLDFVTFRAILHCWKLCTWLLSKLPKDGLQPFATGRRSMASWALCMKADCRSKNIQVKTGGKAACYWHAISQMVYIKQGWKARF